MSNWRRRYISLFPHQKVEAEDPGFTIYTAFMELLPRLRLAHEEQDDAALRKIYGFAEWCSRQPAKDLWNAAGVSFYEHLFELSPRDQWPEIVRWLSPNVVKSCWGLWEMFLPPQDLEKIKQLLGKCKPRYREANLRDLA